MTRWLAASALLLLFVSCATAPVDMDQLRRVVGTESSVRVDAEIRGEELRVGSALPITYDITNQRGETIAIADVIPLATYDAETRTVTVDIGSEVPGEATLPRLVTIAPGEKKTFTAQARMNFLVQTRAADPRTRYPAALRLKVNFLGNTTAFTELLNIPERIVADAKLADSLFPVWLESNEVVYTNTIPMRWSSREAPGMAQPPPVPARSRRP